MEQMKRNDYYIALRSIDSKDAEFLMKLNNDPETAKYVVGNPKQVTLQKQLIWMEKIKTEENTKRFIIECSGKPVGTIIISEINMSNLTANLNIKLDSSSRGKGIGKKSIRIILPYCFEELGIYCVTAHILSYNIASLALFESCGFIKEGVMRSRVLKNNKRYDLISFSMTKVEYEKIFTESEIDGDCL